MSGYFTRRTMTHFSNFDISKKSYNPTVVHVNYGG